jgi:hypothetical protein
MLAKLVRDMLTVVPTNSDTKSLINESIGKISECTACRIQGCHFAEGLHDGERDDTDNTKTNNERSRAAIGECATSADKKTCKL